MARADKIIRGTKGVGHVIRVSGMSFVLGANGSHLGTMFVVLDPFDERRSPDLRADAIAASIQKQLYKEIEDATFMVIGAPPDSRTWQHWRFQNHD